MLLYVCSEQLGPLLSEPDLGQLCGVSVQSYMGYLGHFDGFGGPRCLCVLRRTCPAHPPPNKWRTATQLQASLGESFAQAAIPQLHCREFPGPPQFLWLDEQAIWLDTGQLIRGGVPADRHEPEALAFTGPAPGPGLTRHFLWMMPAVP